MSGVSITSAARGKQRLALGLGMCLAVLSASAVAQERSSPDGRGLYERECLACHMRDGRGVPGMNPPLIGSPWVTGSPEVLAGFVLSGGFGPDVLMAPFDYLDDAELAALLSYVRATFGEGASPLEARVVAAARANTRELGQHSPNAK